MLKSIIFDLDGTLLDTVKDLALATNKALEDSGFKALDEENYNYYLGDGAVKLIERVLEDQPEPVDFELQDKNKLVKTLVSNMKAHYKYLWTKNTKPYEGISQLVSRLKDSGCLLAVVSNKPHDFAVEMAEYFFGDDAFEVIIGQKEGVPVKPSPDGLYCAIEHLNITKEELLYVGDTDTDMKTAENAGVVSIGVTWGFRNEEELKKHGANHIVNTAPEILSLYRKL